MVVSATGLLATAAGGEVRLLAGRQGDRRPARPRRPDQRARLHPRRPPLATAASDGSVRIWDTASRTRLAEIRDGGFGRKSVAFGPDARTVAVAAAGRPITIFNTTTAQPVTEFPAAGSRPLVLFGNDADTLYTLTADGLEILDVPSGKRLRLLPSEEVTTAALTPNTRTLAVGRADGGVEIWGVGDREFVRRADFAAHDRGVEAIAFSPAGTTFTTGGADARRCGSGRPWAAVASARTITGHTGAVVGVAYSPDGHHLITAATDRTVRVWNMEACDSVLDLTTRVADPGSGTGSPRSTRSPSARTARCSPPATRPAPYASGGPPPGPRSGVPIETRDSGSTRWCSTRRPAGWVVLSSDNVISLLDVDSRTSQPLWANPPQEATNPRRPRARRAHARADPSSK